MDILDRKGLEYEVVPGVSSFFAAAAALKKEYTLPSVTQTVILTRMEGRTPVPGTEDIEKLAAHKSTMVIFLSVGMIDELVEKLKAGYEDDNTPIAVVYKASWPEQRIVRGTLKDITRITSYNVCYTKLLRKETKDASTNSRAYESYLSFYFCINENCKRNICISGFQNGLCKA